MMPPGEHTDPAQLAAMLTRAHEVEALMIEQQMADRRRVLAWAAILCSCERKYTPGGQPRPIASCTGRSSSTLMAPPSDTDRMIMIEIDIATTDDKALAKGLVDAAQLAREQASMPVVNSGIETIAAIVPYGVALALEPGVGGWLAIRAGPSCQPGPVLPGWPQDRQRDLEVGSRAAQAVHADDGTMWTDTRTPTAAA